MRPMSVPLYVFGEEVGNGLERELLVAAAPRLPAMRDEYDGERPTIERALDRWHVP